MNGEVGGDIGVVLFALFGVWCFFRLLLNKEILPKSPVLCFRSIKKSTLRQSAAYWILGAGWVLLMIYFVIRP